MRGGIPWGNDPCTKPQVCEAWDDPKDSELTLINDSSDSTSGSGLKAVSAEEVGQKRNYIWVQTQYPSVPFNSIVVCARIKRETAMETANEQFEPSPQDVIVHVGAIYPHTSSNKDLLSFFA